VPDHDPSPTSLDVSALLFDNDGVLVDSVDSGNEAWTLWAREHDLDPAVLLPMIHGRRAEDTVATLVDEPRRAAAVQRINDLELATASSTRAMPGARELLAALDQVPWAVVTSAIRALAVARLQAAGLPLPAVLVTAEQVGAGKPAPDGYRTAAERLRVPASECVVFEDAPAGVEAGYAAGVAEVIGVHLAPGESATSSLVTDLSEVSVRRTLSGVRLTWG
jgi:sugar-phosphatase